MNDNRKIVITNSAELMDSLMTPAADPVVRQVRSVIEADTAEVAFANRQEILERLSGAERDSEDAQAVFDDAAIKAGAAQARAAQAKPGNGFMGIVFLVCVLVCLAAEFGLTLATLPYILGFQQWSVLGIALAIAPTTALVIMDKVLGRLVEDPWERIDSITGYMRWLTTTVMLVCMVTLGLGNIWTVGLLADARERVTEMRHALEHKSSPQLSAEQIRENRVATQKAILAVSIFVTLDGAMFSLFGLSELRRRRAYRSAHKEAARLDEVQKSSRTKLLDSRSKLRVAQQEWAEADERSRIAANRFREQQLFRLEQILNGEALRSSREIVTSILKGSARAAG